MPAQTIGDVLVRALDAYAVLGELGEEIEDEWTYVTELGEAWRERLEQTIDRRGTDPASDEAGVAIDRVIEEVGRITDPHRAIDWLSTFPQVALTALGEQP
jgi:hypothetical protein